MSRRLVLAVVLAVFLMSAGCSSISGQGEDATPRATLTPADVPESGSSAHALTPTPAPDGEPTNKTAPDRNFEYLSLGEIGSEHRRALRLHNRYKLTITTDSSLTPGESWGKQEEIYVNHFTERMYQKTNSLPSRGRFDTNEARFRTNGTRFTLTRQGVKQTEGNFSPSISYRAYSVDAIWENVEFTHTATETRNGTEIRIYEAHGPGTVDSRALGFSSATVLQFDATLHRSVYDGVPGEVRLMRYSMKVDVVGGDTQYIGKQYRWSKFNEPIKRPTWLPDMVTEPDQRQPDPKCAKATPTKMGRSTENVGGTREPPGSLYIYR